MILRGAKMKKIVIMIVLFCITFILYGCEDQTLDSLPTDPTEITDPTETTTGDTIPPLFVNAVGDTLSPLRHRVGETIDLLDSIQVMDNIDGNNVLVEVDDLGGYDKERAGIYIVRISATDLSGNTSYANRRVTVVATTIETFDAFVIEDKGIEYIFNSETALNYTSSGTQFRSVDAVQIMDIDFFLSQYEEKSVHHTNNAQIPYLPHGVVVLLNQDMQVQHLRVAPSSQVDNFGNATSIGLNWTNSIDAVNGGGNFKNIIQAIQTYVPDGGFIVFTGAAGDQLAKKFLIQNLFSMNYTSGAPSVEHFDVNITNVSIRFEADFEVIKEIEEEEDVFGEMAIRDGYYAGIPTTTYYINDGTKKPVIYFFHGFAGDRKTGIMGRGEQLAQLGFFVVAMDAYLHGERQPTYFRDLSYGDKQKEIVNIQIQTAKDAKMLFEQFFKDHPAVDPSEVFTYGVSMGAGSAFYLGKIMEEVSTIVSIVGSPSFYAFYQEKQAFYSWPTNTYYDQNLAYYQMIDPLLNFEAFQDKNIFMGNGATDTTVPKKFAEDFASKLNNDNVVYKVYDIGHSSTPEMLTDSYNFLQTHKP